MGNLYDGMKLSRTVTQTIPNSKKWKQIYYSLQRFIGHAARPETRLVKQNLSKISHLRIHGALIAVMDYYISPLNLCCFIKLNFAIVLIKGNLHPPEECVLSAIHPRSEGHARILSKRRDYACHHQCQKDKAGWKHNLRGPTKKEP